MHHYTYKIIANNPTDTRRYYIGVRSCKCWPTEDVNYFGSCRKFKRWQKAQGTGGLEKKILAIWPSRELALEHEIRLHDMFDVAVDPEYWNRSKQTSTGFDTTGVKVDRVFSKEQLDRVAELGRSNKGKKFPQHIKERFSKIYSKEGNPFYGKQHSEETIKILSEKASKRTGYWKGRSPYPHVVEALRKANIGKKHTQEHREKNCNAHSGDKNHFFGKTHTEEARAKISAARLGKSPSNKGSKAPRIDCPHCGKNTDTSNAVRWHFDNCKFKESGV
jgi:hypothetical protein